jgi:porphobilinogen synthase
VSSKQNGLGTYPATRMRRNRREASARNLVAENRLSVDDLIWPIFVIDGKRKREPVESMPGVDRLSVDLTVQAAREAAELGIPAIALFPNIKDERKNETGSEAVNPDNLVCRAISEVKEAVPQVMVVCDVALDPFTSHGHDGVMSGEEILNDETLEVLCRQAIVQARAGCDTIAPSDMMDGRVGAIRRALDAEGFTNTRILAYAAKYASAFYGPFRDAIGSKAALKGDKRTYQIDPANSDEALREVALDIAEGADMVMIKPGLPYLDIIHRVKDTFGVPTYAYCVSGEYAMLKAAAERGWLDWDQTILEVLIGFKRAGADGILTYAALELARILGGK